MKMPLEYFYRLQLTLPEVTLIFIYKRKIERKIWGGRWTEKGKERKRNRNKASSHLWFNAQTPQMPTTTLKGLGAELGARTYLRSPIRTTRIQVLEPFSSPL